MARARIVVVISLLLGLLVMAGCSTTQVGGSWTDDAFKGKTVGKIMVIGVSEQAAARRIFEQQVVNDLRARGVDAVSAYVVFQTDEKLDKEQIAARAREQGVNTLLVTKVTRAKKESEQRTDVVGDVAYGPNYYNRYWYDRPSYHRDWYDYYGRSHTDTYSVEKREYTVEYTILSLETNLYDLASDRLAWSALLETIYEGSIEKSVSSISKALVKQMNKDGLIP